MPGNCHFKVISLNGIAYIIVAVEPMADKINLLVECRMVECLNGARREIVSCDDYAALPLRAFNFVDCDPIRKGCG